MTDTPFKDFDATEREIREVPVGFQVEGAQFIADMNLNAGDTLVWMRQGSDLKSTPLLMEMVLGKSETDRLIEVLQSSKKYDTDFLLELVTYLGEHLQMGGSGN